MDNSDRRISVVDSYKGWTVSVIMDYVVDSEIALSPYPMVIVPLGGARLEIDLYRCPLEYFSRSFLKDLRLGAPLERRTIGEGELWATPAKGIFADIVDVVAGEDGQEPVVLVISGEAYAPYVRVFDRYGNMTSTVFSSNKFNGQQFFADFVKNMAASNFMESMSGQERQSLFTYIADQLSDPSEIISEALWPMVQASANVDRSLGIQVLRNVANSSHEMASHASAVLAKAGSSATRL